MKKALFMIILFCTVGLSTIHISSIQTVNASLDPETTFTNGETIWHEIVIYNDEEVSYPQVRIVAPSYYVHYSDYPSYYYTRTMECEGIVIEDGMSAGTEKTVWIPCDARNDSAQGEYWIRVRLDAYQNGWTAKQYKNADPWNFNPDQPWTGAYVKSINLNEENNPDEEFEPYYKFYPTITVHNFNPTYDLVANLTLRTGGTYANCQNIGEVTLPANSDSSFDIECTTKANYKANYVTSQLHFGQTPIWGDTLISHYTKTVYVDVGECPDGVRQPANGESCDTNDLGGHTCVSQGYESGTLACNSPPQTDCRFDYSDCKPKPILRVHILNIQPEMVFYKPSNKTVNTTVNFLAKIFNSGNVDLPEGSYLRVKFEDLNTNQVLFSNDTLIEGLEPNAVFSDWYSFVNGEEYALFYFRVSATVYSGEGTYIPSSGENLYSPATAGVLTCTNTTEGGLVHFECNGTGIGYQLLKIPKKGGNFESLTTSPTKALYFYEYEDDILIWDEPVGTVYHITLAFPVEAAPGLSPILAVIVMVLVSALVWEKYVK